MNTAANTKNFFITLSFPPEFNNFIWNETCILKDNYKMIIKNNPFQNTTAFDQAIFSYEEFQPKILNFNEASHFSDGRKHNINSNTGGKLHTLPLAAKIFLTYKMAFPILPTPKAKG